MSTSLPTWRAGAHCKQHLIVEEEQHDIILRCHNCAIDIAPWPLFSIVKAELCQVFKLCRAIKRACSMRQASSRDKGGSESVTYNRSSAAVKQQLLKNREARWCHTHIPVTVLACVYLGHSATIHATNSSARITIMVEVVFVLRRNRSAVAGS